MRLRSAQVVVVILAAGLVAVAAGCGGGGTKSSPSTSNQASAGTTESSTMMETTSGGSSSVPTFASAKNCQDLANLATKVGSSIAATSGNPATALDNVAKQLQALANAAPSDIRPDFQTFATALSSYLHALEKAGFKPGQTMTSAPTAAQIAALAKAAKSLDTPKLRTAEQHLSTWVTKNCKGVTPSG